MVTREKGESGDDSYRINATLVHMILATLFGSIASVGGYMAMWAVGDATYKATLDERITNIAIRIGALERSVNLGILPLAQERIEQLERRMRDMEAKDRENHRK